jgi:hypothetical protein
MRKQRKWPLVTRKEHERELDAARRDYANKACELACSLDQDKKDLREVIRNLHEVSLVYDTDRTRWRVVLDFSPHIVMALERGNDARMLDYITESIAHHLKRELNALNIKRPADVGLGRRRQVWADTRMNSSFPETEKPCL